MWELATYITIAALLTLHPLMHNGLGTLFHSQVEVQLRAATAANRASVQDSRRMFLNAMASVT